MPQFIKFSSVGVLNTLIDLSVLNVLILFFGIGSNGEYYVFFKAISFILAVINSYLFNKYWVFQNGGDPHMKESFLFLIVSSIGLIVNVAVSFGVLLAVHSTFQMSEQVIANIGALAGTLAVVVWNFIGYKHLVFRKNHE